MTYIPYPRSLYRLADGGFFYEGRHFEVLTVEDAAAEKAARADGFVGHPDEHDPLDHDGDGRKGGSLPKAKRVKRNDARK